MGSSVCLHSQCQHASSDATPSWDGMQRLAALRARIHSELGQTGAHSEVGSKSGQEIDSGKVCISGQISDLI